MNKEHEELMRDLPLLARLWEGDLRALAELGRVSRYGAGEAIFREGDPGDSLHMVMEGEVRIFVLSPGGDELSFSFVGPGECFGDLALLDGRPRSASAVASQLTRTLVVTRGDFILWLSERPRASLALLETLSLRLRRLSNTAADLVFLDLPHRLAKRLITLAYAQPEGRATVERSEPVRIRITQEELASMLGVSRQSVNKQLNLFAREGWIALGRGYVMLKDPVALRMFV